VALRRTTQPLSLEELLKKRAADSAAAAKPVFLSKAQREALAAKEKTDEEEAARRKCVTLRPAMPPSLRAADSLMCRRASEVSDHSSREWARQARQAEERRRDEERRKRDAEREHEKQMELIKLQVSPPRSTSTSLHL
jgi:ATP-dependent RNA helicase DDX23/PRP28